MDNIESIRRFAFQEAKESLQTTTGARPKIAAIILEAKKLEAYIDVNVNPDPKEAKKLLAGA
ncbi:hypothetical protein LCGC14_2352510 [marine sediment metagenome]|uniref:Uncharacterized protein n=1 Tax=marine sediment metagenome TaxID=412755 RepID=A0A0F9CWG7_9ZZZZ